MPGIAYGAPMMMACSAPMPQMCFRSAPMIGGGGFAVLKSALQPELETACFMDSAADGMDAGCEEECDVYKKSLDLNGGGANVEEPEVVEEDKLTTLIGLQSSDGHFRWNEAVAKHSGSSKEDLMSKRPDSGIGEDIWITVILIAMLESMAEDKDLWELVVLKAKKFLAKTMTQDEMDKLLTAAAGILQSS